MNFDWIVDGELAAMAMPWPEDLPELKRRRVTAVLSLSDCVALAEPGHGFAHLLLHVRDFHPPTRAQLDRAVEFIDVQTTGSGACVIHCGAGLGRTGTVAAVWLVRSGMDARKAIIEVRRRRPGSIETDEQEDAIFAYARERHPGRGD